MCESPALDIIELLRQKGAEVRYHDPYVAEFAHNGHGLRSEANLAQAFFAIQHSLPKPTSLPLQSAASFSD